MPSDKTVDTFGRLSELFEKHGVYAILVVLIFFIWYIVWRRLGKTTSAELLNYYEKIHSWVLAGTLALMFFTSGVWLYANFFFFRQNFIKGAVSGLVNRPVIPDSAKANPLLVEQIIPHSSNVDFYSKTNRENATLESGEYVEEWVLAPRANLVTLVFTFQHKYKVWTQDVPSLLLGQGAGVSTFEGNTVERRFTLNLKSMGYSPATPFELIYKPNPEIRKVGTLYRRTAVDAKEVLVPWLEDATSPPGGSSLEHSHGVGSSLWSILQVFAGSRVEKPVFQPDGRYDPQTGRALRLRLGNPDLKVQLDARNILVQNGGRSLRFIEDCLKLGPEPGYDRGILVSSLASAVSEIEAGKTAIAPQLNLQVALALFRISDYEPAAKFFQKAGDGPIGHDDLNLFYRGFSYSHAGLYDEALKSYDRYLRKATSNESKATTHTNMGYVLQSLHRDDEAIQHYRTAIMLQPQAPLAFNNLAFLYAENGTKLKDALFYARRALSLDPGNPYFMDTKGWVLFQLGRTSEALPLLKEAAAKLPNDKEVLGHLQTATKVPPRPSKKQN